MSLDDDARQVIRDPTMYAPFASSTDTHRPLNITRAVSHMTALDHDPDVARAALSRAVEECGGSIGDEIIPSDNINGTDEVVDAWLVPREILGT